MPSRRRLATEVVLPNPIFRHTSGVWPERLGGREGDRDTRDPMGSEHGPTWSVVIGAPYARVPFFLETEVHHENIMRLSVTKWPNKSCSRIKSPTHGGDGHAHTRPWCSSQRPERRHHLNRVTRSVLARYRTKRKKVQTAYISDMPHATRTYMRKKRHRTHTKNGELIVRNKLPRHSAP